MKRQHKATSKMGDEYIKPFKPSHKQKILEALDKLKVGGTYESIALAAGMREDQVWKRLSEAEKDGTIFNTGITRKLKSGLQGTVWQKTNLPVVNPENPKTDKEVQQLKRASAPVHPIQKSFCQTELFQ